MNYDLYNDDINKDLLDHFLQRGVVAVDTETTGLNMFRDEVCTIQLSDGIGKNIIVKINPHWIPENTKKLLENQHALKVFHHAPFDVSMLYQSLGIDTNNFHCLKVMSKIVRTYTDRHRIEDLTEEILGNKIDKSIRRSCWFVEKLSLTQEKYAIRDVVDIIDIYRRMDDLISWRGTLRSGFTCKEVHIKAQTAMQNIIPLLVSGYGSHDSNWDVGWIFKY